MGAGIFAADRGGSAERRLKFLPRSLVACLLVVAGIFGGAVTYALDEFGQIEDPKIMARYDRITHELRCVVCQNNSIADSNVQLAKDLCRQVRELLLAGNTDEEVFDFMTARYGEFIRFKTPLEGKTLFIWGAPFFMLLLGGTIVFRIVRQRSRMPLDDTPAAGSA